MPTTRFLSRLASLLVLVTCVCAAQNELKNQPTVWADKPDIAAFNKVEEARLAGAQKSVEQLLAVKDARTIQNTLVPYDEAIRQLNTASYFAGMLTFVHPDAKYRDAATAMNTKVTTAISALSLNQDVYKALAGLDVSKADAATKYYVQRTLLEFRLAGVDKDDATRKKLNELTTRVSDLQSTFERNIADDQPTVEAKSTELDGLPKDFVDKQKRTANGNVIIPVDEPNAFPVLLLAQSDDLRRRVWESWSARAYPKNQQVLLDMMKARYEIAQLIGYSSWADYNAADKMIGKGSNIEKFVTDLNAAARPIAEREYAMLLTEKKKTDPTATDISTYQSYHLTEMVRRSQYNFDSQTVRPYLPFNEVKQGVMNTAASLFHISFRQEQNVPSWDPSVETWDVLDNGKVIGRFYLDMFPRPGKYSHQQMVSVLDGIRGRQIPEAMLICNFLPPSATDPGLMQYSDVIVFFHEFGHLMHHILAGQQQWAGIAGISMEADFGEAPSQMLEEFMRSPQVLQTFAKHYKTGETIPLELIERMNRASAFNRGNSISTQNAFSSISYDFYKGDPAKVDMDAVAPQNIARYTLYKPIPTDAHMYASFDHLASYSSAYYTYMYDKVISEDFYGQFDKQNLLAGEAPMRYRRVVLEPGGSMSANDLVKNFLGRPQNMEALQKWMGEEFKDQPATAAAAK